MAGEKSKELMRFHDTIHAIHDLKGAADFLALTGKSALEAEATARLKANPYGEHYYAYADQSGEDTHVWAGQSNSSLSNEIL